MKGKKYIGKNGFTTNIELEQMALIFGFKVIVLSKDEFKPLFSLNSKAKNGNYIINMEDSDKGSGTHWVALKVYDKQAFYFNTFGLPPPLEVIYFVNNGKEPKSLRRELYINGKQIQNIAGAYCGQYCIDFLRYMNKTNKNLSNLKRFNKYIGIFKHR